MMKILRIIISEWIEIKSVKFSKRVKYGATVDIFRVSTLFLVLDFKSIFLCLFELDD
jgi:hypothetical protein